jgi:hypothetical protein
MAAITALCGLEVCGGLLGRGLVLARRHVTAEQFIFQRVAGNAVFF